MSAGSHRPTTADNRLRLATASGNEEADLPAGGSASQLVAAYAYFLVSSARAAFAFSAASPSVTFWKAAMAWSRISLAL